MPLSKDLQERLLTRLVGPLDRSTAGELVGALIETLESDQAWAVIELLDELDEVSQKVAQSAVEALPELTRRSGLSTIVPWLDLGVALAESSGAAALKYFKESPLLIGLIEPGPARSQVLTLALELADRDANVALNFIRTAPELLMVLPAHALGSWAEVGAELARWDYVLGIEFVKQSPAVVRVIPLEQIRAWVGFGMKLITQNSLGKTDYLGTLEFFRTSPAILRDIEGPPIRQLVIGLGSILADRDPKIAISFLAESPGLLRQIHSEEWRARILQYGVFVAERDGEATVTYLRRCPEILALLGQTAEAQTRFENWFKGGMDVLEYSVEGVRAYFSLETKKALASVEQAMSGVPLRRIARSLKLFAEGLCGTDVAIRSLADGAGEPGKESVRASVSADGRTIRLPSILRRYPTPAENIRLYTIMTAHEAGHLEFGTYRVRLKDLSDVIAAVQERYGRSREQSPSTLGDLFGLYPQPGLIRDLWMVLEDARVEYRLRDEYPGLARDLALLARESVTTRSLHHGMSVREMVVDALLLLSTAEPGTVRIPEAIAEIVERIWAMSQAILTPVATAEDVIRLADRLYLLLEEMVVETNGEGEAPGQSVPESDSSAGPNASEERSNAYRPVTNWSYRGQMNPNLIKNEREAGECDSPDMGGVDESALPMAEPAGASRNRSEDGRSGATGDRRGEQEGNDPAPDASTSSVIEHLLEVDEDQYEWKGLIKTEGPAFLYDEWDGVIQDYRTGWCRVVERLAPGGDRDFVEATLTKQGGSVTLLRRYFESIRPTGLRRIHGQADGEDLDLDAAIGRAVDRLAGAEASDRIYIRREKKERDVAVVFLVDLSGSTSRQIDSEGSRRIIDVEKEGLVLLCEALEAIGDQYAVYGYSGQGRRLIDFVVVKDFDESIRCAYDRIGGIAPLEQNRDGAAIRHAARKLLSRSARVRLLVLINDGKPLDDAYADEYALEDTKMALREARMQGIDPFCITIDRQADDYLRRMYGDVHYVVVDHAGVLPERLPRIYRRLTA